MNNNTEKEANLADKIKKEPMGELNDIHPGPPSSIDKSNREKLLGEEEALAQRVSQGDSVALVKLYENYVGPIYRYFYSRVGNISDAQDLTSEVFTRAIDALLQDRYTWQDKFFGAWLFGIAARVLKEQRRMLQSTPITEGWEHFSEYNEPESEQQDVLDSITQQEEYDALWQLIKELNMDEQRILVLRHAYGMSYAEIARRLGSTENACKQAHYRVLKKLKLKAQEANLWDEIIN